MTFKPLLLLLTLGLTAFLTTCASGEQKNPVEAGTVSWTRDHDAALTLSKKSGKPVFALFQEVPG